MKFTTSIILINSYSTQSKFHPQNLSYHFPPVYHQPVLNNIKNIVMNTHLQSSQSKSDYSNRKFSLLDRMETQPSSQRELISSRYREFFQSRRKSCQESSSSFLASTMGRSDELQSPTPSVRLIREQKIKMDDMLRQTLTKYNFMNLQKERKIQLLNQKKLKYQRVIKIRQESQKDKVQLSHSRALLEKQEIQQKLKLKRSVDFQKSFKDQSMLKHISQKKLMAQGRKEEKIKNMFKIRLNKSMSIQHCRNLRAQILSEEKQTQKKRLQTEQSQLRMNKQCYFQKLNAEIDSVVDLEARVNNAVSFFNPKVQQLQRQQLLLDDKLRKYSDFLKDGSTLKKINFSVLKVGQRKSLCKIKIKEVNRNCFQQ